MNKKILFIIATIFIVIAGGIGAFALIQGIEDDSNNGSDKTVVTTLFPYYSYLEATVGDEVDVEFIGSGDPHDFEPRPQDIATISDADLIIFNGGVDEWMHDIIESEDISDDKVLEILEVVNEDSLIANEGHDDEKHSDEDGHDDEHSHEGHDHGEFDPHVWVSPKTLLPALEAIEEKVSDTFDIDTLDANDALTALEALDAEYSSTLSGCNYGQVVVSHRFLEYVARDYVFNSVSIRNEEDGEPTPEDIATAIAVINENNLANILVDNQDLTVQDLLGDDVDAQALFYNNMESLTAADHNASPYDEILRSNLETLSTALGCQ